MKQRLQILSWCLLLAIAPASASEFPAKPNPPKLVNDFAGLLMYTQAANLEKKLVAFDDSTSTQITIVTVPTIYGYDIDDYNARLGEQWGVGRKGKDNGVVILVAKDEREVSIATGYGVEPVLPDALCKRIIDNYLVPNFKQGNFYEGLDEATTVIMQLTTGQFTADDVKKSKGPDKVLILVIILIILFIIISNFMNRGKYSNYSGRGRRGGWGPWMGGGFGGFGGGSSGGGGFGGFGGGSFGGGGASGRW